MDFLEVHD